MKRPPHRRREHEPDADPTLQARLDAYFDGRLSPAATCELFRDLSRRPEAFVDVVQTQAMVDALREPVANPDFVGRVLAELDSMSRQTPARRPRTWRRLAGVGRWAAAAAALAGLGLGIWMRTPETTKSPAVAASPAIASPLGEGGPLRSVWYSVAQDLSPGREVIGVVTHAVNQVGTVVRMAPPELFEESAEPELQHGPADEWIRRLWRTDESEDAAPRPRSNDIWTSAFKNFV